MFVKSRKLVNTCVALALVALVGVLVWSGSASAASSWWHVVSSVSPTSLNGGLAKSEIQTVTVSATGGFYLLETKGAPYAAVNFDATDQELREALESNYGAGTVQVTGGPGDELGDKAYQVTFVGNLAGQPIELIEVITVFFKNNLLTCEGAGPGCRGAVSVSEVSQGRPDGQIVVSASNLGIVNVNGEPNPVKIMDSLPPGLKAVSVRGVAGGVGANSLGSVECSVVPLECGFSGKVPPYDQVEMIIGVVVEGSAKTGEVNETSVSGGGIPGVSVKRPIMVGGQASFGVEDYELSAEEEGGALDTQAGSHPFQITTTLLLNNVFESEAGQGAQPHPVALGKDLHFKLPPGLIGNPTPFSRCTLAQFYTTTVVEGVEQNACPAQSVIGVAKIKIFVPHYTKKGPENFAVPLYNLEPSVGEPARFGFDVAFVPVFLDTSIRTGGDYGVTVSVSNITQEAEFLSNEVTFWGVPGDPRHDNVRGSGCIAADRGTSAPCQPLGANNPPPLLSLPTSCNGALQTTVEADSWKQPDISQSSAATEPLQALDGCNRLPFSPSISVTPDGQAGSTPTGLTVGVHVPQDLALNPTGLAESNVKDTTVVLPQGVGINPGSADGLQACSEAQIALDSPGVSSCPDASKVGIVKIKTPLLPNQLEGPVYLAAQNANPFGSLVALYVFVEDPISGSRVKLAGEVKPDPVTGQLVSTFKNTPQLPFETFELHFFGGNRAPLSTPGLCGSYTTTSSIAPWSGNEPAESDSTFDIASGPNGSPCSDPLPFSPSLTAGTTSIQAGGFSPFTMTMSRPDGGQNLRAIKLRMPPGLLGTLATVKLCKEAQANAGTCGPESLIGHTVVSVGVGGNPYSVTGGEVFITEGYAGAPYGLSIVNPAKAGPFDLGKVIVRAKIEVDPITAVLTITTDDTGPYKIPTILDGIPLQIQHVNVSIDRPGFTFNPTNCSPLAITGGLTSDQGSTSNVSVPFQITNCAVLAFKPKLTAKTSGKTSRSKGASLSVKLTYPAGPFDANIAKVKVDLPKQLPSRLTTLQKACPARTFEGNPAACPSASIVGHAKATTPVLPVSLEGPAYFVSHGGEEFPQLIVVLQGYGTTVHLVGSTFISKAGITSSTFKTVPDVPVGTFELTLPQGKYSALAANGNLCTAKKLAMPTSFVAQNGAALNSVTPITPTGCAKHKAKKAGKHKKQKPRRKKQ
jgi:hypothetical protein